MAPGEECLCLFRFDYHFSQFRGALVSYKFPICFLPGAAYFRNLDKARKRECNRDYYGRNSDKLNATGRSLYEGDPSKKKAASGSPVLIAA